MAGRKSSLLGKRVAGVKGLDACATVAAKASAIAVTECNRMVFILEKKTLPVPIELIASVLTNAEKTVHFSVVSIPRDEVVFEKEIYISDAKRRPIGVPLFVARTLCVASLAGEVA